MYIRSPAQTEKQNKSSKLIDYCEVCVEAENLPPGF